MSKQGMMNTVFITELKAIQPDISEAALEYIKQSILEFQADSAQALETVCQKHGICSDCGELFSHWLDEPMASCACKQSEWGEAAMTPFMLLEMRTKGLFNEHNAEAAKVELCRQAFEQLFGHCCSNGVFNHLGEPMDCTLLNQAMNLKPDDCLKQVKADSGRAGYLQALEDVESRLDGYYATTEAQDIAAADQYAERVKQGLVK